MRSPPPVALACDGGVVWAVSQGLLQALTAAVLVAWLAGLWSVAPAAMLAAAAAAALAIGVLAWRRPRQQPQPLAFDGECWTSGLPAVSGQVELMMDLGVWMLLRFRPDVPSAPARWLAVSAVAGALPGLHSLRVAVHSGPGRPESGLRLAERQPG